MMQIKTEWRFNFKLYNYNKAHKTRGCAILVKEEPTQFKKVPEDWPKPALPTQLHKTT